VRDLLSAAACSLALVDQDGEWLEFGAAAGAGAEVVVGMRIPAGQGSLASGQPIELSDVARDPRFARDVAECTGYVPRSILAMPVESSQQTLGVLEVLDRGGAGGLGADKASSWPSSLSRRRWRSSRHGCSPTWAGRCYRPPRSPPGAPGCATR
jgi:GAF domain-containing protein